LRKGRITEGFNEIFVQEKTSIEKGKNRALKVERGCSPEGNKLQGEKLQEAELRRSFFTRDTNY